MDCTILFILLYIACLVKYRSGTENFDFFLFTDGISVNVSAQGCSSASACKYDFSESAATRMVDVVENECYIPTDTLPEKKKPEQ